jgi:hypothetical protein
MGIKVSKIYYGRDAFMIYPTEFSYKIK